MDQETLSNFISKVINGDNTAAQDDFENIIANKLNAALDVKKVEVAQSIYGQEQGEEESAEDSDQEDLEQDPENAVQ